MKYEAQLLLCITAAVAASFGLGYLIGICL